MEDVKFNNEEEKEPVLHGIHKKWGWWEESRQGVSQRELGAWRWLGNVRRGNLRLWTGVGMDHTLKRQMGAVFDLLHDTGYRMGT